MTSLEKVQGMIARECEALAKMLIAKNEAYGNSALEPVRIFSKASPIEQLLVRIDDKLSRIARGSAAGEDVENDLAGYFVLLRVARRLQMEPSEEKRYIDPMLAGPMLAGELAKSLRLSFINGKPVTGASRKRAPARRDSDRTSASKPRKARAIP